MATIDQLTIKFVADVADLISGAGDAQDAIAGVGDETEKMSQKSKSSLSSILPSWDDIAEAAAAAGAIILAVTGASAKSYLDFEQVAVNAASVTGLTGQAYQDALENIKAVSAELGSSTTFSASEAADAMYDLASAGFDVANMTAGELEPILDIASGTQSDLAFSTKTVTDAISQFGLTTADSGRIADVYATAIGKSKATMEDLSNAMNYIGPISANMGRSLEETTAVISKLNDAGFSGEQAGTAFRTAMLSLLDPSKEAVDTLSSLGISIEDLNPTTHTYAEILGTLAEHGMSVADASKIFGKESAAAMVSLVGETFAVEDLTTSLQGCEGAAGDLAAKQRDTLAGSLDELGGSIEGISLAIGEKLAPHLRDIADYLTGLTPSIQGFIDGLSGLGNSTAFAKIREFGEVALRNLKDQLGSSASAISTFVGSGGLSRLAEAAGNVFSAVIRVNDVLGELGVYRALGTVLGNIVKSFLWVIDTISKVINWLANLYRSFNGAYQQMSTGAQGIRTVIGGAFQYVESIISSVTNTIRNTIGNSWNFIRNITSTVWNAIRTVIVSIWDAIRNHINTSMNTVRNLINTAWNAIRTLIVAALNAIRSGVVSAWGGIQSSITTSMNTIRNLIVSAWNTIRTAITTAMNAINTAVSTAWSRIRSTISTGVEGAISAVTGAASRFYTAGSNWIGQLIDGVSSRISSLRSMVNEALSLVGLSSGSSSSSSSRSSSSSSSSAPSSKYTSQSSTAGSQATKFATTYNTPARITVNINNKAADVTTVTKTVAKAAKSAATVKVR